MIYLYHFTSYLPSCRRQGQIYLRLFIIIIIIIIIGHAVATIWQVAGSIAGGVIGIFQWHNPSGRTMALGSTQPLTEMSTRFISWG